MHMLETTPVAVPLETGTDAGSGGGKNDAGTYARGDKLATWRTLRDRAGLLTQVALSALPRHAVAVCRPLLAQAPGLRPGDLRLEARGWIDGATRSELKRTRQIAGISPLTAHRLAAPEAMQLAAMADKWAAHPSRAAQRMAGGHGVEQLGPECHVPLHAWVMHFWQQQQQRTASLVLVTTAQDLRASWLVRHYEERPEIAQDDEQMQSGGWQRKKRSAPRYREIVF
jgi:hypothetical protein